MTRKELIELMNEMFVQMNHIATDLTKDPCAIQKEVNELYNLAQFLPYDCEADEEDDDWDAEDDDWDEQDEWEDAYEMGCADGYEEGREAGFKQGYVVGYQEARHDVNDYDVDALEEFCKYSRAVAYKDGYWDGFKEGLKRGDNA